MTRTIPRQLWSLRELIWAMSQAWVHGGSDAVLLRTENELWCLAGDCSSTKDRFTSSIPAGEETFSFEVIGGPPSTAERLAIAAKLVARLARREREVDSTAAALIEANDQLLALYDLAAATTSTLSRDELVAGLAADAMRITDSGAALLICASGHRASVGESDLLAEVAAELSEHLDDARELFVVRADAGGRDVDVMLQPIAGGGTDWLAMASKRGTRYGTPQLKLADAVCAHIADRLQIAAMHEQALERAVIERDVATASALAAQVLPKRLPVLPGVTLLGRCDPARLASGDYYTVVHFDDRLVFSAGDVSGKGLPAALVMAMVSSATKAAALRVRSSDPGELLQAINADVYDYLDETGRFVTTAVGVWHVGSDTITVANAGHSPVLLLNVDGSSASVLPVKPSMPPLGVLPTPSPSVETLPFKAGSTLLLGTDGLSDQLDVDGKPLGADAVSTVLLATAHRPIGEVMTELFACVERHGVGATQDDDRTALLIRRTISDDLEGCR
jgi:serine phosphatase RsbU (regulator of sigma subunit)